MRVAVLDDYQGVAEASADWSGRLPAAEVTCFREHIADPDALAARLLPYEVVVAMRERTPFPAALLERLPRLRLLVTTGGSNRSIDLAAARERGIVVCGTRGNAGNTVELTWALILGLVRGVAADDARIRAGGWQGALAGDLEGETLGIVGLGRLGGRLARIAQAFGMRVLAWSPNLTAERAAEHGAGLAGRADLFAQAKIVTIHMVLSERTAGLIGEADLRAMRPDAYLVNTSRGPLVREAALRRALEEGWIAGAGLDVYDVEPLPADHWLRRAPRTLLTPHVGYVSQRNYRLFYGDVVEDIAAWLAGAPVRVL
jgi:phosphoglycerate dehydrogenase-like enzyme